jgi:formylaminopyrimidine deformylase / aminopyrimidine aminohydrolase
LYAVCDEHAPDNVGRGLVVASLPNGPVADFCAALRELQVASGISRSALAREIHYGRSQLYDILDGRIRRPPEWDRLVEPLLRSCLRGKPDVERLVADWRTRYEVLLRVHDELTRRTGRAAEPAADPGAGPLADLTTSQALLAHSARLWPRLTEHPFVRAVGSGALTDTQFRRWMVNDYYFNIEYQRFIAGVAGAAPDGATTETVVTALSGPRLGLTKIRRLSQRFAVDVSGEPEPTTVGLAAYLQAQLTRGFALSLAGLYAAERAYFDAWSAVRPQADRSTPYWPLIDDWSNPSYEIWLATLGRLVDTTTPTPELLRTFDRVIRLELLFLDALETGLGW